MLRAYPEYQFDSQTMDIHLAFESTFQHPWATSNQSEDLASSFLYYYGNTEGQIGYNGKDFMVRDVVAYPSRSGVPPSPSIFLIDRIKDPMFPLTGLADGATAAETIVVDKPPNALVGEGVVPALETNTSREIVLFGVVQHFELYNEFGFRLRCFLFMLCLILGTC